jgi:hypothetical protein
MPDTGMLEDFLAGACVDAAVFALRPDYRVLGARAATERPVAIAG